MPDEGQFYWDYLKSAFGRRVHIPLLGQMPINQMAIGAFGLLGILNPGFWLLGAAGELLYLYLRANSPRFRALIAADKLARRQQGADTRIQDVYGRLSETSRQRYRDLVGECHRILGITALPPESSIPVHDLRTGNLNQLLWLFLRLLSSRELIAANLSQVDPSTIEAEIDRLKARLAGVAADSALARSLQGTLEIQAKRLENVTRAHSSAEVIDAELERIEQQVRLIREESAVSGGPEALSARLDAVTATLGETSRWMDQNAELFGTLVGDDLDAGPAALTRLPEAPEPAGSPAPPPPPAERLRRTKE